MTTVQVAVTFVAFTASWCEPCRRFKADFADDAMVEVVDVAVERERARRARIKSYPTVIAYVDGKEVARHTGYEGRDEMIAWMERVKAEAVP